MNVLKDLKLEPRWFVIYTFIGGIIFLYFFQDIRGFFSVISDNVSFILSGAKNTVSPEAYSRSDRLSGLDSDQLLLYKTMKLLILPICVAIVAKAMIIKSKNK